MDDDWDGTGISPAIVEWQSAGSGASVVSALGIGRQQLYEAVWTGNSWLDNSALVRPIAHFCARLARVSVVVAMGQGASQQSPTAATLYAIGRLRHDNG